MPSAGVMRALNGAERGAGVQGLDAEGSSRIIDHSQLPAAGSLKGKPWNADTSWDDHAVISQDLKPSNDVTIKTSVLLLCLPVPTIYAEIFISQFTAQSLRLAAGQ